MEKDKIIPEIFYLLTKMYLTMCFYNSPLSTAEKTGKRDEVDL